MRMWMVDPKMLCRKHLLGEHLECHMFVGTILSGKSLDGYVKNKLVEVHNIKKRHDELAEELNRRNYKHQSPLPDFKDFYLGGVDINQNIEDLKERCEECFQRMNTI